MNQYHSLRGSQLGINAARAASYGNSEIQPIADQVGVSHEAPLGKFFF